MQAIKLLLKIIAFNISPFIARYPLDIYAKSPHNKFLSKFIVPKAVIGRQ